ncbi:hypothetical protein BU16DRAFT_528727 [Lophium mytilinum]|uniref:Pyoverdine/dityrosine biosynthesis protein n=1 Tax=Lophium mytilinum TaxID=390894 RepID=A0A6A6QM22_9PEZI|nr:hypothetical protein BU16DRAFT_528727 [Lophium mytilinum]
MVEVKRGDSPYHQIRAQYTRDAEGKLLAVFGPEALLVEKDWETYWGRFVQPNATASKRAITTISSSLTAFEVDNPTGVIAEPLDSSSVTPSQTIEIWETQLEDETQIRGLLKLPNSYFKKPVTDAVAEWAVSLVLKTARLAHCQPLPEEDEKAMNLANTITDIFSDTLRNIADGDQWDFGGRDYFRDRILLFTSRKQRIDMILPAFPCKSSSLNKVAGTRPDKGEELGLRGLYLFVKDIEKIYPPGACCFIASDGHVFSDNIGVDDEVVDTYSSQLIEMKDAMLGPESNRIGFFGLPALFALGELNAPTSAVAKLDLPNYVNTKHTEDANLCRKLMVHAFGIDGSALRNKIESGDKAALALYRGFTRFMLEDLSHNGFMMSKSKSQQKKLAAKIAFEMLKRNQAYSNLCELLFPASVRLSIHAHVNSGPKFGCNLLSRFNCRTTASLLDYSPEKTDDLLHVPTPWHNTMVKMAPQDGFLLIKACLVHEAIGEGKYTSAWVESNLTTGEGGYFLLTSTTPKARKISLAQKVNSRIIPSLRLATNFSLSAERRKALIDDETFSPGGAAAQAMLFSANEQKLVLERRESMGIKSAGIKSPTSHSPFGSGVGSLARRFTTMRV